MDTEQIKEYIEDLFEGNRQAFMEDHGIQISPEEFARVFDKSAAIKLIEDKLGEE